MKFFYSYVFYFIFIIFLIFALCFFIPIFSSNGLIDSFNFTNSNLSFIISSNGLVWPTPGFNTITSGFGYRNAPTYGAGTFHGGIDIGAPMRYKYNILLLTEELFIQVLKVLMDILLW